jgi:hypothetical protein
MGEKRSIRSWGYSFNKVYDEQHSKSLCCKNCDWDLTDQEDEIRAKTAIGFSSYMPDEYLGPNCDNSEKIGVFIVECPKCFSVFWFHTSLGSYRNLEECGLGEKY